MDHWSVTLLNGPEKSIAMCVVCHIVCTVLCVCVEGRECTVGEVVGGGYGTSRLHTTRVSACVCCVADSSLMLCSVQWWYCTSLWTPHSHSSTRTRQKVWTTGQLQEARIHSSVQNTLHICPSLSQGHCKQWLTHSHAARHGCYTCRRNTCVWAVSCYQCWSPRDHGPHLTLAATSCLHVGTYHTSLTQYTKHTHSCYHSLSWGHLSTPAVVRDCGQPQCSLRLSQLHWNVSLGSQHSSMTHSL